MKKDQLTKVFDDQATAYDQYRPHYPQKSIEDIFRLCSLKFSDRILEIGCGTGQISIDFLNRGFQLLAIEKGGSLAKIATHKFSKYPQEKLNLLPIFFF